MADEWIVDRGLWIAGGGTDNPTLMYDLHPMLKLGPMPELAVFSLGIGSSVLNHELWFDWLVDHDCGYARVYPESGYIWCDLQADGRLYPFVVDHWDADHPVVDLFHLDPDYWRNFDRVLQACAERDIVVHLQLYQRCYLMPGDAAWSQSYYHPANNVNGVDASADSGRSGYGLWQKTIDDYPDGPLWCIHRAWVQRILSAVGHNRNVIIDLVNEAGDREGFGMVKPWVERTLDIIEEWERETGCSVLKGLFIALWDDQEYLLSHPRLDVAIYHERHMIGKEDRDIVQDRQHYGKPAISVHNGPFRRKEVDQRHFRAKLYLDVPETVYRTHYHWTGMMEKVQGLGEYFEDYADINLFSAEVVAYGQRTRFVMGFFRSLLDYAALRPSPSLIVSAPGHYRHVLASSAEMIVYLHTQGWGASVPAGERLALKNVPLDDGPVDVLLLDMVLCTRTVAEGIFWQYAALAVQVLSVNCWSVRTGCRISSDARQVASLGDSS